MDSKSIAAGATTAAIERVYRAELGRFHRVARAVLGDVDAAHDVVQDAFATAVRKQKTFRAEGDLEGWLWRLVMNAALSEQRRRARRPTEPLGLHEPAAPSRDVDLARRIGAAVAELPERQRLATFLHYYADLDYEQIAEVLSVRPGTVAASLHAARQALGRTIDQGEVRE